MTAKRRAFTIIELLVVITIISVLAGLLLPVIGQARAMARSTTCISNLRQLGVAMSIYQVAYNHYPAHQFKLGTNGQLRIRWFHQLHYMLGIGTEVQTCPDVPSWVIGRNNSYGYNYKYLGSARDYTINNVQVYENFPVNSVPNPSHTIAFGDAMGTGNQEPYEPLEWTIASSALSFNVRKLRVGNHGYCLDPTYIPTRSQTLYNQGGGDLYSDKTAPSFAAFRHLGKANFCMVDGHVESLTPEEVYTDNSWWNGYGTEDPRDVHEASKIPGLNTMFGIN